MKRETIQEHEYQVEFRVQVTVHSQELHRKTNQDCYEEFYLASDQFELVLFYDEFMRKWALSEFGKWENFEFRRSRVVFFC